MHKDNLNYINSISSPVKICITGAHGFIASSFMEIFRDSYRFITISQQATHSSNSYSWHDLEQSPEILTNIDVVLNLTGANIGDKRWSNSRKVEILDSRIRSTAILVKALNDIRSGAKLINASAVGIYPSDKKLYDESSSLDFNAYNSFSEEITKRWEGEATKYHGNLVITRFGVVLSNRGGAFRKIVAPFKFGLGGLIGNGDWPFSWISLHDLLNGLNQILTNKELTGVFNLVSPNLISYHELISTICEVYQTKMRINLPKSVIKLIFGQMGDELLIRGQKVRPTRLTEIGFDFEYGNIKDCINAIKHDLF